MASAADIGEALKAFAERAVVTVALEVHHELVAATPVLTGHARANWVPSVGQPNESEAGSRDAVDSSTQIVGEAQVGAYQLEDGDVFESNHVTYIEDLNNGSSPKAPAGFVEAAIDIGTFRADQQLSAEAGAFGVSFASFESEPEGV